MRRTKLSILSTDMKMILKSQIVSVICIHLLLCEVLFTHTQYFILICICVVSLCLLCDRENVYGGKENTVYNKTHGFCYLYVLCVFTVKRTRFYEALSSHRWCLLFPTLLTQLSLHLIRIGGTTFAGKRVSHCGR